MPRRRVVVTGLGPVTPIGTSAEGLWEGLRRERSVVRTITRFDPALWRSRNAGEVADFDGADYLDAKRRKRLDRFGQFTVVAAQLALADAGLDLAREDPERVGAMMGTALGGVAFAEGQLTRYNAGGAREVDPALALTVFGGAASCNLAIEYGLHGPNSTNGMSCASGAMALGDALRAVRDGYADVMLAGGAEAPLMPLCYGAFAIIRAMSTRNDDPAAASRPFDRDRDGFVMAEGAAVLVLEERERALARGARVYAELAGYGASNDGYHMTAPRPDGRQAARAMCQALADARVAPHEVGYVNAHGSSTPLNDPTEAGALRQVFGEHLPSVPVSGTKGYYGHALGASGAFEAAISALAVSRGWLPPTVNLAAREEGLDDLDLITGAGRESAPEVVLSNSFGFGGINAALVFRRHDG